MQELKITEITPDNLKEEGLFCISNPKHIGYQSKKAWFNKRYQEGLKMRILYDMAGDKLGYIEYIPSEYAWRPVQADNYMFIHCLFIYRKQNLGKGYGSYLIKDCINHAKKEGKNGVAVTVSSGTWMAGNEIFARNGFTLTDEQGDFVLMALKFNGGSDPTFPADMNEHASKYSGLNLIYSDQCPYASKGLNDIMKIVDEYKIKLNVIKIDTAEQLQKQSPSPYGTFTLTHEGKIVSHHCISGTRFKNIISKELKII